MDKDYQTRLIKSFIGKKDGSNSEKYYLKVIKNFENKNCKIQWNMIAFFGNIYFFIYKRMYGIAGIILWSFIAYIIILATIEPNIVFDENSKMTLIVFYFLLMIISGLFANFFIYLEYKYAKNKLDIEFKNFHSNENIEDIKINIMKIYYISKDSHYVWIFFLILNILFYRSL